MAHANVHMQSARGRHEAVNVRVKPEEATVHHRHHIVGDVGVNDAPCGTEGGSQHLRSFVRVQFSARVQSLTGIRASASGIVEPFMNAIGRAASPPPCSARRSAPLSGSLAAAAARARDAAIIIDKKRFLRRSVPTWWSVAATTWSEGGGRPGKRLHPRCAPRGILTARPRSLGTHNPQA
jgi:hypothetical protein